MNLHVGEKRISILYLKINHNQNCGILQSDFLFPDCNQPYDCHECAPIKFPLTAIFIGPTNLWLISTSLPQGCSSGFVH